MALVGEADKSLKAIDRVLADTRLCAHQKSCPEMKLSLGLCQQRKAAVTTEQRLRLSRAWRSGISTQGPGADPSAICWQCVCKHGQLLHAMTDDRERPSPAMLFLSRNEATNASYHRVRVE